MHQIFLLSFFFFETWKSSLLFLLVLYVNWMILRLPMLSAGITARCNASRLWAFGAGAGWGHSWDCPCLLFPHGSLFMWLPSLLHIMVVWEWANFLHGSWLPRVQKQKVSGLPKTQARNRLPYHLCCIQWVQAGPWPNPGTRGRDCTDMWTPGDVVHQGLPKHSLAHTSNFNCIERSSWHPFSSPVSPPCQYQQHQLHLSRCLGQTSWSRL